MPFQTIFNIYIVCFDFLVPLFLAYTRFNFITILLVSLYSSYSLLKFQFIRIHKFVYALIYYWPILIKGLSIVPPNTQIVKFKVTEIQKFYLGANKKMPIPDSVVSKTRRCTDVQLDNLHILKIYLLK